MPWQVTKALFAPEAIRELYIRASSWWNPNDPTMAFKYEKYFTFNEAIRGYETSGTDAFWQLPHLELMSAFSEVFGTMPEIFIPSIREDDWVRQAVADVRNKIGPNVWSEEALDVFMTL